MEPPGYLRRGEVPVADAVGGLLAARETRTRGESEERPAYPGSAAVVHIQIDELRKRCSHLQGNTASFNLNRVQRDVHNSICIVLVTRFRKVIDRTASFRSSRSPSGIARERIRVVG
ncbi:hypothetical protein GEO60473_20800 [Geobacter sp. 60473]|nr:hypothetical protein GEO60473_20800 [Geobacter sp. 60473]